MRVYKRTTLGKVRVVKDELNKWVIYIDAKAYTPLALSKKFSAPREVVYQHIKKVDTVAELTRWLENRADLLQLGLSGVNCKLFRKGDEVCWIPLVMREVDCNSVEAGKRLKEWVAGGEDYDCDYLFAPMSSQYKKKKRKSSRGGEWGDLSDKPRDYNLDKITDCGEFEKSLRYPEDGMGYGSRGHSLGDSSDTNYLRGD